MGTPEDNPWFGDILRARADRRSVLVGGLSTAMVGFLGGSLLTANPAAGQPAAARPGMAAGDFTPVPTSIADTVVVPDGYRVQVVYRHGDRITGSGPPWRADASATAADQ